MIGFDRLLLFLFFNFALVTAFAAQIQTYARGTLRKPIIDSRMNKREAFDGLDQECPADIRKRQRLIKLNVATSVQK